MKKIIIPTDFSENAQKAIDYALLLFKDEACKFYILHAYHDVPSGEGSKMSFREDLYQLVKKLKSQPRKVEHQFEAILETDSVYNLTKQIQIKENADYIFVGTKGLSAFRDVFIGSNTLRLIKDIKKCPVISVPPAYVCSELEGIIFATDFKYSIKPDELSPLIEMAVRSNATLNVAHIKTEDTLCDNQKSNKEKLRKALSGVKHYFYEIQQQDSVANTLIQIKKVNKQMGMLAILKTNHGFFKTLTRENVVKNIAYKTEIPLMVLQQIK